MSTLEMNEVAPIAPAERSSIYTHIVPTPEQAAVLHELFKCTTLFWNYCVDGLREPMRALIESTHPDAVERFTQTARAFGQRTILTMQGELDDGDNPIPESWTPYLTTAFELPADVLDNRLVDLIAACCSVKTQGPGSSTALPSRKTDQSTLTIRLNAPYFTVTSAGVAIRIPGHPEFDLDLAVRFMDFQSAETIPTPSSTLTITRHLQRHDPKYGPIRDEERATYRVSLSNT